MSDSRLYALRSLILHYVDPRCTLPLNSPMKKEKKISHSIAIFIAGSCLAYWVTPKNVDFYGIAQSLDLAWPHSMAVVYTILGLIFILSDYLMIKLYEEVKAKQKIKEKRNTWLAIIPSFLLGIYICFFVEVHFK